MPPASAQPSAEGPGAYWAMSADRLLADLRATADGLSSAEAAEQLRAVGSNTIGRKGIAPPVVAFARQFRSPLVLILIFAAIVSAFVGEGSEAVIIGVIVLASCVLTFTQEYGASRAMEALKTRISRKAHRAARRKRDAGPSRRDRARRRDPAFGRKPDSRGRRASGSARLQCQRGGADRRDLSRREGAGRLRAGRPDRHSAAMRCSPARRCAAARRPCSPCDRRAHRVRLHRGQRSSAACRETEFARGIRRFGYLMTEIMLVIVHPGVLRQSAARTPADRTRCCSRWRSRWASRRNCCRPSSASRWRAVPGRWRRTASSSAASTPSRTSAAWTCCAPTRRAR